MKRRFERLAYWVGMAAAEQVPHGEEFVGNPETHGIDEPRGGGFSIMQDLQKSLVKEQKKTTASDRVAKEKRIDVLRRIIEDHQNEKIDGVRIDPTTASMLVKVYEVLEKKGSDMSKFDRIPLMKLVDFGWSSVTASDYSGLRSRRAMYWGGPGRTYRLTKEEQQNGMATCPKCKGPMEKEPFMRGEKLYLCPECRFKVPTSKTTTTRIQIDVAPDGEVDVDVTTAGKGSKIGRRTR